MLFRPPFYRAASQGALAPAPGFTFANSEAEDLVAAFTTPPSDAWKEAYDDFIGALKTGDIWDDLDAMWIMRAPDSQAGKLEAKSAGASFTLVDTGHAPTFTAARGWAGNGTSQYLDTTWDPTNNGVNFTLNSATMGVYLEPSVGADTASNSAIAIGEGGTTNTGMHLAPRAASDLVRGRSNSAVAAWGASTTRYGLTVFDRSASNLTTAYRDGSSVGTTSTASNAISSADIYICCQNNSGAANYVDNRIGLAFVGGTLGSTKQADLDTAWDAFVTATASL